MLRSIIAIWTIALGLLAVAAISGCGGCLSGDSGCGSYGYSPGPDLALPPPRACPQSCPTCGANEICFQGSGAAELPSFCARQCADDRDCASGETCAALFASMQPSVCISAGQPRGCGSTTPNWHCDLAGATCRDATTLSKPFSNAIDQVCGWAQIHCTSGCVDNACR